MSGTVDTSLVRIHTKAGGVAGAGFLVGERHILTCAHVVAQALGLADDTPDQPSSTISLDFPQLASHTLLTAEVAFWYPVQTDGRGDIAGLKLLDEPPAGAEAVSFVSAEQVWGHPYRAFGFPAGQDDGVWSDGRLLGRQGTNWIQLEDDTIPGFAVIAGFSGTPVWDTQAQGVVGMIVASSQPAATKAAFAIPSDVLLSALPELKSIMRPPIPRNPYKGLHAFNESDARDFFGREALIDELIAAVKAALTPGIGEDQQARLLTVVLGPSGSGKSSVVMAGLLPCLRDGKVVNSKEWVYLDTIFPGAHPLEALAVSLAKQLPARGAVSIHSDLENTSTRSLHLLVSQITSSPEQKVVLLVDQFEEIFTLTIDEKERRHFFELLVTAVTEPLGPLFVILTLRADFYDRPMQYPELFRLIDNHHVSVLPLERADLRKVIVRPASLPDVQVTFEDGLIDELLLDMQGQSGALPLLEFTLDQLFQQRNGHQLTLQAYHEMGGVKGALSKQAEETYEALPTDAHRQAARDIFLRLIELGATELDTTRRRASRSEFERTDPVQAQQIRETLEAFILARLLTINQVGGQTTVEVSHEALIREWKRLAGWLHEARDDIRFQHSLSEDVEDWEQHKRPRDRLYRGAQLKEAQKWAKRNMPSEQEAVFLQKSANQRILTRASIISLGLLLVTLLGIVGWYKFFQPDPTRVTTLQDSGVGSLRWCIENAPSGSTITFAPNVRGIIDLTGGELVIAGGKRLTIVGPGPNKLTITGSNRDADFHVSKDAILNVSGLSFKNSETIIYAFLYNEGTLRLSDDLISGNKTFAGASSYGGGIYNRGILSIINTTISNNSSIGVNGGQGGGIDNEGQLTVTGSTISNNSANSRSTGYGGGIYNYTSGTLSIINTTISNNSSIGVNGGQGGGIGNSGKLTVTGSTISNNSANSSNAISYGGGIYNYTSGTLSVTNSKLSNNLASGKKTGQGGGIDNQGKLNLSESTFSNNMANGIENLGLGGGIYNYTTGKLFVTSSTFSANTATGKSSGGGGAINNRGNLTITESTFSNNVARGNDSFGGGILSLGSKGSIAITIIRFTTIYANKSDVGGGIVVLLANSTQPAISESIIADNSAPFDAPDIFGVVNSGGFNLIEDTTGVKGLNATTDKQVTLAELAINPTLGSNDGPTQTLALNQGSQAIDAVPQQACSITVTDATGQNVTISTDQRGRSRPDDSEHACDTGAYESSY